jgi:type VI secretion system secreted protein Hcp
MPVAYEFYVTIEGAKQGKLKGESVRTLHQEKIPGLRFDYTVKSPRDAASGQASGKRQHQPIKFTKEWGAASPQLFQALCTNEVLKSVLFEFMRTNDQGAEESYQTVKLTNASVAEIHQYTAPAGEAGQAARDTHELEDISVTFAKIEIENVAGKTMATDDWKQGR